MQKPDRHFYEFDLFRVIPSERLLLRENQPVALTSKAFDTLLFLIQRNGHLVSKSDLMKAVWRDTLVEEGTLAVVISMLRKVLGDEGPNHKFIQTIPKQGYRFLEEVRAIDELEGPVAPPVSQAKVAIETPIVLVSPVTLSPTINIPNQTTPFRTLLPSSNGLRMVVALVLLVPLAAIGALTLRKVRAKQPEIRSLAVIPFEMLYFDSSHKYLGVGLADSIITRLASTGRLVVRPTIAVLPFSHSPVNAIAIGKQQNVDCVLVGSLENANNKIRVNLQLLKIEDGSQLWTAKFDKPAEQFLQLEKEISDGVAAFLSLDIHSPGTVAVQSETQNPSAYQLYLEGRYFWNKRTEDSLRRSIEYFQRATQEDPTYAAAFAGLADSYALLAPYGVESFERAYPNARAAALRAVQLNNHSPEAYASLGMIAFYYEWNWAQSEQEFRRAIQLDPNYAMAHTWYALNLSAMGRLPEALIEIQKAHELDPVSLITSAEIGRIFYWNRQYDRAIEAYKNVTDLDPQFARTHTPLGMAYAAKGDYNSAIREFKEAQRLSGGSPYVTGLLGYAEGLAGNTAAAHRILLELTGDQKFRFVPAFSVALVYVGLKDRENALQWLEKAFEDRSAHLVYSKIDPLLDPIRSETRFLSILNRMALVGPDEKVVVAKQ